MDFQIIYLTQLRHAVDKIRKDVYKGRHNGAVNMTCLDGHVESINCEVLRKTYNTGSKSTNRYHYYHD